MNENRPSYGNRLGFSFFQWTLKLLGLKPAYFCLLFVIPYYILFRPSVFRSSDPYLKRIFPGRNGVVRYLKCIRYINAFATILIDQVALGIRGPKDLKLNFPDREKLYALSKKTSGLVLLTTHVGPWQSVMDTYERMACKVHFHFDIENWKGGHFFDLASQRHRFHFISPRGHLGGLVEITRALLGGDCVAMMGDLSDAKNSIWIPFLGDPARFSGLPYRLALSTESDIAVILTARTGPMTYTVEYECLTDQLATNDFSRDELAVKFAGCYVNMLERFLKKYPYMWFNFFDIWKQNSIKEDVVGTGREI